MTALRPSSASPVPQLQVITHRRSTIAHLRDIWRYRELLAGLVRKELKVKYKNSTLGFLWSMLNPAMYLVVFYVVFQLFLKSGLPYFPVYLLSGLLVWNLFSSAVVSATSSISGNHQLVGKVWFPREILPLSSVGAAGVHFCLQAIVLFAALGAFRYHVPWAYLWLIVPALVVLLMLTCTMAIFLSAINVYARDTQHLMELVLLAWMWLTPIVYSYRLVADKVKRDWLPLLNPITSITVTFQRGVWGKVRYISSYTTLADGTRKPNYTYTLPTAGQWWYLRNLAVVFAIAAVLFIVVLRVFDRLEGNFAEEL